MSTPQLICILGAESTGKTTLARALGAEFGCPWVAEYLREFCDVRGRTPTLGEQRLILEAQCASEEAAQQLALQQGAPWVFCDTAPLLTAVYSDFIFADRSLHERARALHARYALTLLLEPDLAWVADGLQRDGEHVRTPVTRSLRIELDAIQAHYVGIAGYGPQRLRSGIKAVNSLKAGPGRKSAQKQFLPDN